MMRRVPLLLASGALLAACDAAPRASDTPRTATRESARPGPSAAFDSIARVRLADSAAGDAAAIAALPPRLAEELAVRDVLTETGLADTARATCERLGADTGADVRRRFRAWLPDSSRVVLFARADRRTGALRRVEHVRRRDGARGAQRGFIWDGELDLVETIDWTPASPRPGAPLGRPESATLPRGGPTGRVLRALARRLLVLPCTGRAGA